MKICEILRNAMMDALTGGVTSGTYHLKFYDNSGIEPVSPEYAVTGVYLGALSSTYTGGDQPGLGLTWEPASGGVVAKLTTEQWACIFAASGGKGYARLCLGTDMGGDDTVTGTNGIYNRIQYTISDVYGEADIFVGMLAAYAGQEQKINAFTMTLPESAVSVA